MIFNPDSYIESAIVQKEIIELIKELQKQNSMSVLFISHDISLVSHIADKIIVMKAAITKNLYPSV